MKLMSLPQEASRTMSCCPLCEPEPGSDTLVTSWALPAISLVSFLLATRLTSARSRQLPSLHHSFTFSRVNQLLSPFSQSRAVSMVAVHFSLLHQWSFAACLLCPPPYDEQRASALRQWTWLSPESCCHSRRWHCFPPPYLFLSLPLI